MVTDVTETGMKEREKQLRSQNFRSNLSLFFGNKKAVFGTCLLLFFVIVALFGPAVYKYNHNKYAIGPRIGAPTTQYVLGFDEMGRDVMGEIIYGTRASFMIGIFVTLLIVLVGSTIGIVTGYYGGMRDIVLMRITEAFMLIPSLPLILTLAAIIGQKFSNIILILGLTGWTGTARLVRSQTLTIKQRNYVERAKSLGAPDIYIMFRHILPNVFPIIFSNIVLLVQGTIITESTLAFLGIGDPTIPTWGQLLRSARVESAISTGSWWMFVPAGVCIVLLGSSFVFMGYGFDEILNPKLRKR